MLPVMPKGMTGAIMALTSLAILRAIATGAVMSAPLLITPCGSIVPVGRITVLIFAGTTSLNSIQLMSLISRVETVSDACARAWVAARVRMQNRKKSERNIRKNLLMLKIFSNRRGARWYLAGRQIAKRGDLGSGQHSGFCEDRKSVV